MKYVSDDFIKKLLNSTNIVNIISSEINLKSINNNKYISCCPFHKDKNPSFLVNEDENYYYCFGCKSHGNVIDFLMKFYNINFLDSIKKLSIISNINIKYNYFVKNKNYIYKRKYFSLIYKISKIYNNYLLFSKKLYYVRDYLFNRGLDFNLIKYFFIGYSFNDSINKIISYLSKDEINFLIKFNFFANYNNKIYDKFYNRIIFPIFNDYNYIVGFGGCSINKKYLPKYINSSKNIFFLKKYCLYGFNLIKKKCVKIDKILVVEGYFDVIILNKFGINYVVGLLGSSISVQQIKLLYLYTNKIIFCYDGDISGISSIKKTVFLMLNYVNENRKSFFIFLPSNEDPDSIIRKEGLNKFNYRIDNCKSIFDVLFILASYKNDLLSYIDKINYVSYFIPIINKINSFVVKLFLYQKLSYKVGLSQTKLFNLCNNYSYNKKIYVKKKNIFRYLISLLLKNLYLSNFVNLYNKLFKVNIYGLSLFLKIVNICVCNYNINFKYIIKYFNNYNTKLYLEYLYLNNFFLIKKGNEKKIFLFFLNRLKIILINKSIKNNIIKGKMYG